jgi:hypothetical protein
MTFRWSVIFAIAAASCASPIGPGDAASDGGRRDGALADGGSTTEDGSSRTCEPPLRTCHSGACPGSTRECPVNCRTIQIVGADAGAGVEEGICTNSGPYDGLGLFEDWCVLGVLSCDRDNTACFGEAEVLTRVDPDTGGLLGSRCIPIRDCVRLPAIASSMLGPGQRVSRCTYDDQTLVTAATTPPASCQSFDGTRTCGTGCEVCPMGQSCRFASERSPTGICAAFSTHCAEWPTRRACSAAGTACVRPIRGAVDGFTDQQRAGACVPLARCRAIAAAFASEYRCDESLAAP